MDERPVSVSADASSTWCDLAEACAALGGSPRGVAELVASGRLRVHGGPREAARFSRREVAALAAWLREES